MEASGLSFIQNKKNILTTFFFFFWIACWLEMTSVKMANPPRWAKTETLKMIQQILLLWFKGFSFPRSVPLLLQQVTMYSAQLPVSLLVL
ncbi:hypothetical protein ACRRTK_010433 [Alexandromys fortis]